MAVVPVLDSELTDLGVAKLQIHIAHGVYSSPQWGQV